MAVLALVLGLAPPAAGPLLGQTPPDTMPSRPDTLPADTVPGDTLPADTVPADTVPAPEEARPDTLTGDTLPGEAPFADTLAADTAVADTAVADTTGAPPLEHLPAVPRLVPEGVETGVWAWDREALLANRALTLAELLEQIPGVSALRGGDYGTPRGASAFGAAGGGIRVLRDGVEMVPLEGSVPDLARIGLGSLESVRVLRTGRGLRIELESVRPEDPRPYSLVEAGTGDLDTNLFRGAFVHPRALGGNVALSLDRLDTTGPGGDFPGSVSSVWLRYSWLSGDRFGLVGEFTRATSDRDTLYAPGEATRTDWTLRGRARIVDGLVAEGFWSQASLATDTSEAGPRPFPFRAEARSQLGGALTGRRGPLGARLSLRSFSGEGLPDRRFAAEVSVAEPGIGGVAGSWRTERWDERSPTGTTLRAWSAPFYGLSVFGSVDDYERSVPYLPPLPPDTTGDGGGTDDGGAGADTTAAPDSVPGPRFTRGRSARIGARYRWRGLEVSGARLLVEADTVHPFGLPFDRGGVSRPGRDDLRGWELAFRLPLLLDGFALTGSGQLWETGTTADSTAAAPDGEAGAGVPEVLDWPYFPRRTWSAALRFHETFYPTDNLEIWADVGVQGRDRMTVPVPPVEDDGGSPGPTPEVATVPFYQSWYARLQIRVVTVRIFITWENFTVRRENRDFPGRRLPSTRALYGVRWTLWN